MGKLLPTIGIAVLAYLMAVYLLGYTSLMEISMTAVVFIVFVLALLKWRGVSYAQGWFFNKKTNMYLAIGLGMWLFLSVGIMGFGVPILPAPEAALGGIPAGALGVTTEPPAAGTQTGCAVTGELKGKDATIVLAAWDLAANNPYSSTVDFGTSCWIYRNGNGADNFVGTSTATSSTAHSTGFTVGDILNLYCGGTSYYSNKIENLCIDTQDKPVNIDAYTIADETDIAITVYDSTGSSELTAAGNSTTADYDLTLGADEPQSIYVQVKVDAANKALNLLGFATASFNDIDYIKPVDSALTKVATVSFLENVQISDNSGDGESTNVTDDYTPYVFSEPVLFTQWDDKKYEFEVMSGSTDPSATDDVFSTIDGAVVCILDGTYAKGADGSVYLDFHDHAIGGHESNVGLTETFEFPVGKNSCVVIEGN